MLPPGLRGFAVKRVEEQLVEIKRIKEDALDTSVADEKSKQNRLENHEETLKAIEKAEKRHAFFRMGMSILRGNEAAKWQETIKDLPKLSDRIREAWIKAGEAIKAATDEAAKARKAIIGPRAGGEVEFEAGGEVAEREGEIISFAEYGKRIQEMILQGSEQQTQQTQQTIADETTKQTGLLEELVAASRGGFESIKSTIGAIAEGRHEEAVKAVSEGILKGINKVQEVKGKIGATIGGLVGGVFPKPERDTAIDIWRREEAAKVVKTVIGGLIRGLFGKPEQPEQRETAIDIWKRDRDTELATAGKTDFDKWKQQRDAELATRGPSDFQKWEQQRDAGLATRGLTEFEKWKQQRDIKAEQQRKEQIDLLKKLPVSGILT